MYKLIISFVKKINGLILTTEFFFLIYFLFPNGFVKVPYQDEKLCCCFFVFFVKKMIPHSENFCLSFDLCGTVSISSNPKFKWIICFI